MEKEFNIMLELMGHNYFPGVFALQKLKENSYIIMEKLDSNLEQLFLARSRKFALPTIALIVHQAFAALRIFHDCGYLHRDLKPENFMVGSETHELKLIDFGLADTLTVRQASTLIGNVRFCARQSHFGVSTKKEDL